MKFVHLFLLGGLMYWAKEAVPPPPYKMENQKPFSLPRLPYKYDSTNIQATAYALLTYVARQELMIDPIVKWLNSQRLTDGGWASTQVNIALSRQCNAINWRGLGFTSDTLWDINIQVA